MISETYEEKSVSYFNNVRKDLIELMPENKKGLVMLEVGAGDGSTSKFAYEKGYASEVHGIELCKIEGSFQDDDFFTSFIIGNVETMELSYEHEKFDIIVCGDVLEHLINPQHVLQKLKTYLKPDGFMIASIPNIREFNVMKKILFNGDFRYEDSGILDKTHLRFFCKKNIRELFEDSGFTVKDLTPSVHRYSKRSFFNKLTLGLFEEFLSVKYYVVCNKNK